MRGFWKLVWIELKVFAREPLGLLATVGVPLIIFLLLGRSLGAEMEHSPDLADFLHAGLPIFACVLISFSAATSLIAIISIYREGGILKRLRATPLSPSTILGAHVFLKLALTAATLGLLVLAGKRFYPVPIDAHLPSFVAALLLATLSILSIGFVVASAVPTARFAQPAGGFILYPLLAVSGLFAPIDALAPFWQGIARVSPVTHAVTLLQGVWLGEPWSQHWVAVAALAANLVVCTAVSSKIFRWE